jgi:hypothetical protein
VKRILSTVIVVFLSIPSLGYSGETTISGRVTDELGNVIESICVVAYRAPGDQYAGGATNADGKYSFEILPGVYRLRFSECHGDTGGNRLEFLPQWYPSRASFVQADPVVVGHSGAIADAAMVRGGKIRGRVLTSDGVPLPDIRIAARSLDAVEVISWRTDHDGSFTVPMLDGDYKLQFTDGSASVPHRAEEWFGGSDFWTADVIRVGAREVVDVIDTTMGVDAGCDQTGPDSDNDGLFDCREALIYTDVIRADTDGDGFGDQIEYWGGTCAGIEVEHSGPTDPLSTPLLRLGGANGTVTPLRDLAPLCS